MTNNQEDCFDNLSMVLEVLRKDVGDLTDSERHAFDQEYNDIGQFLNTTQLQQDRDESGLGEMQITLCTDSEDSYMNVVRGNFSPSFDDFMDVDEPLPAGEEEQIEAAPKVSERVQLTLHTQMGNLDISTSVRGEREAFYSPRTVDYITNGYQMTPPSPGINNASTANIADAIGISSTGLREPVIATLKGPTNNQIPDKNDQIQKVRRGRATKAQIEIMSIAEREARKKKGNRQNTKNYSDRQNAKMTELEETKNMEAAKNTKLEFENKKKNKDFKRTIDFLRRYLPLERNFEIMKKSYEDGKEQISKERDGKKMMDRNYASLNFKCQSAYNSYHDLSKKPTDVLQNTFGSRKCRALKMLKKCQLELEVADLRFANEKLDDYKDLGAHITEKMTECFAFHYNQMPGSDQRQWIQWILDKKLDLPVPSMAY